MTPREIAVFDAYLPTFVLLCVLGTLATWLIDRLLGYTGLYRFVWHPSLFRASLLVCLCGGLGLAVYH
jgi:protein AaeX